MSRLIWIAIPTLILAGCNKAETPGNDNALAFNAANSATTNSMMSAGAPVATPVTDSATYLAKAGAGDLFEIESSKAILGKTTNADIKSFAQMMVDEHGKSTAKVKAAAQTAGLTVPPPALDPAQTAMLDGIKSATGDAADRAYLDAQRKAHDEALALHRSYAASGDAPGLKAAASQIAPVVQHHIDELSKLNAN